MNLSAPILAAEPVGVDRLATSTNYLIGDDPLELALASCVVRRRRVSGHLSGHHARLPQHVVAANRIRFHGGGGRRPELIRLDFKGADSITLDGGGNLVLHTAAGDVVEQAPVMYQKAAGRVKRWPEVMRSPPAVRSSFRVGDYDRSRPLVIDPVLVYSTYLGGSSLDVGTKRRHRRRGKCLSDGHDLFAGLSDPGVLGPAPDRVGSSPCMADRSPT